MLTKIKYEDIRQEAKDLAKLQNIKLTVAQTQIANKYGFNHLAALRAKAEKNGGFIEINPMESMNKFLAQFKNDDEVNEALKGFKFPLLSRDGQITGKIEWNPDNEPIKPHILCLGTQYDASVPSPMNPFNNGYIKNQDDFFDKIKRELRTFAPATFFSTCSRVLDLK